MIDKSMEWVKNLLNNIILLKWVKKFSADNLLDDNKLAEKFGVKCDKNSISIGDSSLTKLLITSSEFKGKEFVRYNIKQLREALDLVGSEGELIISQDNNKELFIEVNNMVIVVSPLPKSDKE